MKSLPAILVSIQVLALCGEAPTVVDCNGPIKVGEEDDLRLGLDVWESVGTHDHYIYSNRNEPECMYNPENEEKQVPRLKMCPSIR